MSSVIDMLRRALKKGDIIPKFIVFLLIKLGYSNNAIKDLEIRNKMFNKIEKKYSLALNRIDYEKEKQENSDIIWMCWLQGEEQAPEVVKKCIQSVRKHMRLYNIVIITEKNMGQYITLPDYIYKKWKKGIIGNAHFSDIIRLELLIKYGGIWIDSTVYLSDAIPDYITKSDLFLFTNNNLFDTRRPCENWFISAKSNSRLLKVIRDLLYAFWDRENKCYEYFVWNLFAYMAINKYPDDWNAMWNLPADNCYILENILFDEYDEDYWMVVNSLTSIHKLSYKKDFSLTRINSNYERIVKGEC